MITEVISYLQKQLFAFVIYRNWNLYYEHKIFHCGLVHLYIPRISLVPRPCPQAGKRGLVIWTIAAGSVGGRAPTLQY